MGVGGDSLTASTDANLLSSTCLEEKARLKGGGGRGQRVESLE